DKLKKEIAIMKRLRHRHIVQLKEVIDDAKSKKVFMILEFMEGGQVIWQDEITQTPLMTVEQVRRTFRQVLLGLEYLHYQGIIHRDIKPANLLWTADRETVKISDFGVSHLSGVLKRSGSNDQALRKTEGSPAFMAPELCSPNTFGKGERPGVGKGIDIWALGVTLFCLLFGRTPFKAPNEYELFNVIWREAVVIP
ncbi:uncharacterized protein MELLADRAFT_29246, partial [Melampsora larici-populina 98AG31]